MLVFGSICLTCLNTTEFNAVVIDVKGDHGYISYPTQNPTAQAIGANRPTAKDFDEVLAKLKGPGHLYHRADRHL